MFINFENYPFIIVDIEFNNDDLFDDYYRSFKLITNGNKDFLFNAIGDCCSSSVFRVWKNDEFDMLKGKIIRYIRPVSFPDDFEFENYCDDDYVSPHLYKIEFSNSDEIFHFMLINYSNGYYDGWIETEVINK